MVHLRVARARDEDEIPLHYESVNLRAGLSVIGWLAALVGAWGGICVMVLTAGTGLDVVGALVAAVGGVLLVGLVRCRRFETTIDARWVQLGAGPLRQRVPVELVDTAERRVASSWRRLYADRELVLRLTLGRDVYLPSNDPDELSAVLEDLKRE